jgi:2-polyprenyl-3-methyl-5-hydroxy-6-metoxy-1,4-benzoquinol methylase
MSNINDTYFEGHYKDIWRAIIPDELSVKEIDFMLSYFNLKPGSRVLDLMCGYGRHALGLARKGIAVTAVDNLHEYINEVKEISDREQLPLKAVQADVAQYKPTETFDLVICMGNSLNFFDAEQTTGILETIVGCLAPGGRLLVNTWSLAEIVFKNHREKSWSYFGDLKLLSDSKLLFYPTRVETETMILTPEGDTETKTAIDYIFSVNEMDTMFRKTGLTLIDIFSVPPKKKFVLGDPRAYLIAEKIKR